MHYEDFRPGALHRLLRKSQTAFNSSYNTLPPFATIPGFHHTMLIYDYMHCMYLGVLPWLLATILLELCSENCFGKFRGKWLLRTNLGLRHAHLRFKSWASGKGIDHTVPEWNLGRLSMAGGVHSWPELKTKAGNCRKVLAWMHDMLRTLPSNSIHAKLRLTCVAAWHGCDLIMVANTMWLSACDAALFFQKLNTCALQAYLLLAREAYDSRLPRYQLKPKHHALDEIGWDVRRSRRNPASNWCFKHEDAIGKLTKLATRTHPWTLAKIVLSRWKLRLALASV